MGIDITEKYIIFSDSLRLENCIEIRKVSDEVGFKSGFGVGTFLTNDFKTLSTGDKSKALNIVIKLVTIDNTPCVKISDDLTKNSGDEAAVMLVKQKFGLEKQD